MCIDDNTEAVRALARANQNYDDTRLEEGVGFSWRWYVDNAMAKLGLTKEQVHYDILKVQ